MTSALSQHYLSIWQEEGILQEPCFSGTTGSLSKTKFVDATRQALSAANLPAKDYAGHTFRIGAATTAATAGLEDSTIQTLDDGRALLTNFASEPVPNS